MKTYYSILWRFAMVSIIFLLSISCKEDEDKMTLKRQFKPGVFEIQGSETSATVAWSPSLFTIPGEVEYRIELSKSATDFSTVDYETTTSDNRFTVQDTDIDIRVDYYARVKAIGQNGVGDSNWLISQPFRITGEIFILPIKESDVVVDAALIKWQTVELISKIVITPAAGNPIELMLTEEESMLGEMVLEELLPGTNYTIEIFNSSDVSKGFVSFRTKPSYAESNVIDLREITGRPNVLADTLGTIPSGSVVLLKRGTTYVIPSGENLDRSVTITSGADFIDELATIFLSSNFNLVAGSAIDSVVFKDLNMYSDNYDGKYVFNINQIGTINKVRFDNVKGKRFRGFFRLQTGTTGTQVQHFIMNNCIVDSLRDFSLVNTNNSNTVANIRVTNTTIMNARKVIDHRSPGSNSILFENCTFYNLPTGGEPGLGTFYFIDLNDQNSANPITITNCIFGKSRDEGMGGDDARGIRIGTATQVTVNNSYKLADFISSLEAFQIPGLLTYSGTSASVFTDPQNGNFRIKDNSFPGRTTTGDPRWLQ